MKHDMYDACSTRELCQAYGRHLSDERGSLAHSLICLAMMQERRIHLELGYPYMRDFCMAEFKQSVSAVYKRLRAAQAARKYPVLFDAIDDGRLHLCAVVEIEPYLTAANVNELVAAATHKSREDVQLMLARRFPRPDVPTSLKPVAVPNALRVSPGTLGTLNTANSQDSMGPLAESASAMPPISVVTNAPAELPSAAVSNSTVPRVCIKPLAPERFELRMTLDQEAHDLLREAQELLASQIPARDAALVLKRVLHDWVLAQRRRKFGLTEKPRARKSQANGRYVPAEVKRQVMERDGGRCTFVGAKGHRCGSGENLEFDHAMPIARGGQTTTANLRLRCRAHNQYEADRVFGAGFMNEKRTSANQRLGSNPQRPSPQTGQ